WTMPKLEILNGKAAGLIVELSGSTFTLGNRRNASVEIKDPWVSFNHAQITKSGDSFFVADARSKSGTFVNDKRVDRNPVALSPNDKISLGKTEIRFLDDRPATQTASASPAAPSSATSATSAASAPPAAPPTELLEKIARLERELGQAQHDLKSLRETH